MSFMIAISKCNNKRINALKRQMQPNASAVPSGALICFRQRFILFFFHIFFFVRKTTTCRNILYSIYEPVYGRLMSFVFGSISFQPNCIVIEMLSKCWARAVSTIIFRWYFLMLLLPCYVSHIQIITEHLFVLSEMSHTHTLCISSETGSWVQIRKDQLIEICLFYIFENFFFNSNIQLTQSMVLFYSFSKCASNFKKNIVEEKYTYNLEH